MIKNARVATAVNDYVAEGDRRSKVGMGVAGDPAYGKRAARTTLAMGFVRKSEKKAGLTRKKKPTE